MNLRCKAGDLAIVLRACVPANIGMIVKVIELDELIDNCWWCESPRLMPCLGGQLSVTGLVMDADLQPIRPPAQSVSIARELEAA